MLLDVDGVLIHSPMWSHEYCRRVWLDPIVMKPFFVGVFQDCTIGKADLREIIIPFLQEWHWKWSVDEYLKSWFDFENRPDTTLIEKIQELRISWIQCHVATNQEKYRLKYLKKEMNFENLFDSIFCSAEMGKKKPQETYYQKIIDTLWVAPSDITYYDDALENIESARNLGIRAVHYRSIHDILS